MLPYGSSTSQENLFGVWKIVNNDLSSVYSGNRDELMKLPPALGAFINRLPPIQGGEGPVPDVDRVLNVLLRTDLSPASVSQKCADAVDSDKGSGQILGSEDSGNRKRKIEETDGLFPGRQWEPSVDEYRYFRMYGMLSLQLYKELMERCSEFRTRLIYCS